MESVVKHVEQTKDRWTDEYMMLKLLHVHTQTVKHQLWLLDFSTASALYKHYMVTKCNKGSLKSEQCFSHTELYGGPDGQNT